MRCLVTGGWLLVEEESRRASLAGQSEITKHQSPVTKHRRGATHGH